MVEVRPDPTDYAGLNLSQDEMPIGHFNYTVVNAYYFIKKLISQQAKNSR